MPDDLRVSLHKYFGFSAFRPGQAEAIASVLARKHTLVVMPTGSGKSLVYQLSALLLPGVTLVVSPLIALMKDQVDSLTRRGVAATYINSTLTSDEQSARLQALAQGSLRLVYVAPERLRSVPFQQALRRVEIGLLAVDEAHCISQWGHDFRPDYLHIGAARAAMGNPVTVALTATATPRVQDDILQQLGLPGAARVVTGFDRPNLFFEVRSCPDDKAKLREVQSLLGGLSGGAAIVYVGTRRSAEEVADFIASSRLADAQYYHAGLDPAARTRVQESFIAGDLPVVVATNAFGMGIDRADVRMVIHYDLPGTLEAYYQEAGRAGRDGDQSRAVLLYAARDRALQEFFIENDAPVAGELRRLYDALKSPERDVWVSREDISLATGMPDSKVRVGLDQLEAAGVIEFLGDNGLSILIHRGAWNAAAAQVTADAVALRRRGRREQLAAMISYAETDSCRRRILLDHFGDHSTAEAAICCDNCMARRTVPVPEADGAAAELSEAQRTTLIVLDAVRRQKWDVGREKLAQMLKGSHAKGMQQFGYDRSPYYARLEVFSQAEVEDLIGQAISMGYLKQVGGNRPVLRLTPQGEAAVKARTARALELPRAVQKQAVAQKKAQREAGGSVALTVQLFGEGKTPPQIAAERMLAEDTIYNHLAQAIGEGTMTVERVVPEDVSRRVREAIAQVGNADRLAPLKMILPFSFSYGVIRCVVEAWKREQGVAAPVAAQVQAPPPAEADPVAAFLSRPHPRSLPGPWREGWALGFHSGFGGGDWQRSAVGDLTYRLKYESDAAAVQLLLKQALALIREHPALAEVDALVPVAPSVAHKLDPVAAFATALAAALDKPLLSALVKTRQTQPQKDVHTLAQKRANVAGAFAVNGEVRAKRLLVLDDLFDSGATLEEATRVLLHAGAASVCVLTLTRTIHSDR